MDRVSACLVDGCEFESRLGALGNVAHLVERRSYGRVSGEDQTKEMRTFVVDSAGGHLSHLFSRGGSNPLITIVSVV